jgi:quinol monooxygenase YgiN
MIKVIAKFFVAQNKIEKFIILSKELVKNTQEEKGCIKYELFQDDKKNNIFSIIEEWKDNCALENHFKSKHFLEIIPQLETLITQPIEVNVYKKIF